MDGSFKAAIDLKPSANEKDRHRCTQEGARGLNACHRSIISEGTAG
jgi:hypothetical protein